MSSQFKININVNNKSNVESDLAAKKTKILKAWGIKWQEIVTKIITQKGIIDTGALKNSMSTRYRTAQGILQVGTNIEYAKAHELGTSEIKARPYLKPSVMEYKDTYENIAKSILEE